MTTPSPHDMCLPDLLRNQAEATPDATAVVCGTESLSFRQLVERAVGLGAYLRSLGVTADSRVGIFVDPSLDLMIGAWGILFAGGAYLPLSPEYPEERLRYMIEDAQISVIVTQEHLKSHVADLAPRTTALVTPADATAAHPDTTTWDIEPGNLAYLIYTSGSTGKPKGVMIEHRSIVNQMRWLASACRIGETTTVLQKTPMSFDAAQWEILAPSCGSTVVMGTPGCYRDPEKLIALIQKHRVTALQCVPTLLQALLDHDDFTDCTSLRQIFSGGEALSRGLARQCLEALPGCDLVNLYGPTECTINSSAVTVDSHTVQNGPNTVSIGRPVAATEYHILSENRVPVGVGEIGELHIGGIQLARGYLHRPELTRERFIDTPMGRLYRTGDLAHWNPDRTVQFIGRADNQVKLRGFRIELEEIKQAIETHDWVKNAAVIVNRSPRTGFQNLLAFVELSPREAALMDQGNHGAHHQSKESRLQVRAQLSNAGCRTDLSNAGIELPGAEPTQQQRETVFARKTYRFFDGGRVRKDDILRLLGPAPAATRPRSLDGLTLAELGEILRYFGQFLSPERLLPKYGYASPGSLYATQMYLEIGQLAGLATGRYYYHPLRHQLFRIGDGRLTAGFQVHFVGKRAAIEPVYRNNIQEVLEIEAGHMIGLFEKILPGHCLDIRAAEWMPQVKDQLACPAEDYYLGTFEIVPYGQSSEDDTFDIYLQAHPDMVDDLPAGQYVYRAGGLEWVSDELVLRKHVIAINQQVYDRASLGISVVSRHPEQWRHYVDLGRALQRFQMNDLGLGFMSSGYSSKSGNDLPSAVRLADVLTACGHRPGPSYFFVGGRVSQAQVRSEGMNEDIVHMRGPAEMIKDDLVNFLPDYMVPNKIVLLDRLPLTANGKIDIKALETFGEAETSRTDGPQVGPRTPTEERIAAIWCNAMKIETASVHDDFFAAGGNSLIAVSLINSVNRELGSTLPVQTIFEARTIEKLAEWVIAEHSELTSEPITRLVRLNETSPGRPIFCWPGLGGYPMNLRSLAGAAGLGRPVFGVQAHGINAGEQPYTTIKAMAAEDVKAIRAMQPAGPYTLWGYSLGARVAFETAYQLEKAGDRVDQLLLIAPGSPRLAADSQPACLEGASFADKAFVTILYSVFAGTITGPALQECLATCPDEATFARFIRERIIALDPGLIQRVITIVRETYQFEYTFQELTERRIHAPITVFKACGDDYSFLEASSGYSASAPTVLHLDADHYGLLKPPHVGELAAMIRHRFRKETNMPHVNIKHFPVRLSPEQQSKLVDAVTSAVQAAFSCDEEVISIALEPVEQEIWNERVYVPEIVNRRDLLHKMPNY